jgi:hypothetical protein
MRITPKRREKYSPFKPFAWLGRWTATVFIAGAWLAWATCVCGLILACWLYLAVIALCQWVGAVTLAGMHPGRHRRIP